MASRRKPVEAFSLFAFQDIITSVTGIVILITLLLAIELMQRKEKTPESQTVKLNQESSQTIEEIRQEIVKLQSELTAGEIDGSGLPSTNVETLKEWVAGEKAINSQLTQNIVEATADNLNKKKELEMLRTTSAASIAADSDKLKKLEGEIVEIERKIKELQDSSRLFFKPGDLTKTTWLVVINESEFSVARVGVSEPPIRFNNVSNFVKWMSSQSASKSLLYFCVRPKGIENFAAAEGNIPGNMSYGYRPVGLSTKIIDDKTGAGI